MSKFLVRCFVFALALMATSYLLGSVEVTGFLAAFIAAIIFAGFNTIIKPILFILSLPITILTFGLFTLVLNGIIFSMVAGLVPGFEVYSFSGAIFGAIIVSIINMILSNFLEVNDK